MSSGIDLTGRIQLAIDRAYDRGHPVVIAYVDGQGKPALSVRGSVHVLNSQQLGLWARSRDTGLAKGIASNPSVSLLFFGPLPDGAKILVTLNGRAHTDLARNNEVYHGMSEVERKYDPEAKGVAVIVDVDGVTGMSAEGPFRQAREPA
jgi:hypothetical protein